jgi:hypothetical protein
MLSLGLSPSGEGSGTRRHSLADTISLGQGSTAILPLRARG